MASGLWLGHGSSHSSSYGPSWIDTTFVDYDEAEDALCGDRSSFVVRNDIMELIPRNIGKRITHPGENAQIAGFHDLFIFLNDQSSPQELRQLVIAYFRGSPYLCGHLRPALPQTPNNNQCNLDCLKQGHVPGSLQHNQHDDAISASPNTSGIGSLYHPSSDIMPSTTSHSQCTLVARSDSETFSSAILDQLDEMKSLRGLQLYEKLVQIVSCESLRDQATSLSGNYAVLLVDLINECLTSLPQPPTYHAEVLRLLQDMCTISGELPSRYWLHDIRVNWRQYIARGGEAAIYKGTLGGHTVVVREVSKPGESDWTSPSGERVIKFIKREVIVHSQLRHQNIIPLLGVYRESKDEPPMMVMPFMENGSASAYLQSAERGDSECAIILIGSSRALEYLHSTSPAIIHGDLHPNNILVNAEGQAVLCDFGFSRIRHEVTRTHTNIREGGRLRFLAPELSCGHEIFRTTTASDVYSLAMTFFNLSTLCLPLREHYNEWAAADAARQGRRPQKIEAPRFLAGYFGMLWDLMTMMWEHDQSSRPAAATVTQRVQEILRPLIHPTMQGHTTSSSI